MQASGTVGSLLTWGNNNNDAGPQVEARASGGGSIGINTTNRKPAREAWKRRGDSPKEDVEPDDDDSNIDWLTLKPKNEGLRGANRPSVDWGSHG